MATTTKTSIEHEERSVAAVIDAEELEEARHDPRVESFLAEADAYLAELEAQGRSL